MAILTNTELIRYNRHLVLDEFGLKSQLKLKAARILAVGAGGLGSPALLYLAAAGIGTLGIVDHDIVALSNLQRQVLFTTEDLNKNKAQSAAERLHRLNPEITFKVYPERITSKNAEEIVKDYDVVLDGTDNFPTRYLLNDTCILLNKTLIYASILKFEGHVAVFNYLKKDGTYSCNYRDLFPSPPDADSVPNCEEAGVIGVLSGIIGSMQASEAIKVLTGIGLPLVDKLAIFDVLTMALTTIALPNLQARSSINSLIDYEDFCGINPNKNTSLKTQIKNNMKEISVQELHELQESGADFQLIDVREPHEYDICNLGGELIPMSQIPHHVDKIARDKQVVVHCRSGKRSGDIVLWLEKNQGFENLYNLTGGILAWAKEIDSDMPTY